MSRADLPHDPIANLSAMLAKWIGETDSHATLAKIINSVLAKHQESYDGKFSAIKKMHWTVAGAFDYVRPNRAESVRQKNPEIKAENAVATLHAILSEGNWAQSGHTLFVGSASLNTTIVEEVVAAFRESTREIVESDALNTSEYRRHYLSLFAEDLRLGRLVISRDAERIYAVVKGAAARSEMSHQQLSTAQ